MAKCIQVDGEIKRVSDDEAAAQVKVGARYVPKSEWKEVSRPVSAKKAVAEVVHGS